MHMTTSPYPRFFPERPLSRPRGASGVARRVVRSRARGPCLATHAHAHWNDCWAPARGTQLVTPRTAWGCARTALAQHSHSTRFARRRMFQALVCDGDAPAGQPGRSGPDSIAPDTVRQGVHLIRVTATVDLRLKEWAWIECGRSLQAAPWSRDSQPRNSTACPRAAADYTHRTNGSHTEHLTQEELTAREPATGADDWPC